MADQAGPDAAWFGQLSGGDRAQSGQDGQPAGPQHRAYCQRRASAREPRARAARQGTDLRVRVRHAAAEAAGGNGFDRGADCDPLRGKPRTSALRSEADIARSVAKVGCDATDPERKSRVPKCCDAHTVFLPHWSLALCGWAARMNWVLALGIVTGCIPLYSDDTFITLAPTLLGP